MKNSTLKSVVILLSLICCISCQSTDDPVAPVAPLYHGAWGLKSLDHESGIRSYAKLDALDGEREGYEFDWKGLLLVRDAGWCGTQPLTYANHKGSWQEENENSLLLTYPQWDDDHDFRLVILAINQDELRCRVELIK